MSRPVPRPDPSAELDASMRREFRDLIRNKKGWQGGNADEQRDRLRGVITNEAVRMLGLGKAK